MSNLTEELFGAISLIADDKIKNIPLDKTIICRITDASKKSEGKYRVQNGDILFYAFSDDTSYAKNDEVRVVVPGDDTKQKYILGRYVKDDGSPVNYVSPADSVINISGNILSDNGSADRGFVAAANGQKTVEITTGFSDEANVLNTVYNTLVIEGDFRTLLQEDRAGEYGIDVAIYGRKNDVAYVQQYTLSSKDMFGDPYNFQIYTPQAKAFSLTNDFEEGVTLIGVVVCFYQRGFSKESSYNNVLVRDLSVWFGADTSKVEDKTSQIYTTDSLSYKYFDPTEATNQKTLHLLWYKKDENDKYVECTFSGQGFKDLENQQTNNKIKAQMGKKDGPKQLRQLYAAAARSDNKKTISTYVSLVKNDIRQLIRSMESEAGLTEGKLTYGENEKLSEIGTNIANYTAALDAQLEDLSIADSWTVKTETGIGIDLATKNSSILNTLDSFFNSDPAGDESASKAMVNATGVFNQYVAKWKILKAKISKTYAKIHVTGFGEVDFSAMTGNEWTKEVTVDKEGNIVAKSEDKDKDKETTTASSDTTSEETAAASYSCYWFVYDEQCDDDNIYTQIAGQHWKHIQYTEKTETNESGEEVKTRIEHDNQSSIAYYCDPVLKTQQFKCIVFEDANYYESNILEFTNSDEIPNGATLDQADSLLLVHSGSYAQDSYLLYGDDGYIIDNRDSSLTRAIACEYDGVKAGNEALNGAVVYWYLPKAGTMLRKAYTNDNDYKEKCGLTLQTEGAAADKYPNHYCYSRTIEMVKKKGTKQETDENGTIHDVEDELDEYEFSNKSNEFYYKLGEFFEPNAANNSIICEAYLLDETRTANDPVFAQKWFTIGQKGTCGTGYTLSVTHVDDQVATTDDKPLNLKIQLFDENGNDCTGNYKFSVEWVNHLGEGSLSLSEDTTNIIIPAGNYGILKVFTQIYVVGTEGDNQRKVNAAILYAVPWSAKQEESTSGTYLLSGCTRVIYTTLGALDYTSLYRQAYSLMKADGNEIEGLVWGLETKGIAEGDNLSGRYYPSIKEKAGKYYLEPVSMYLTDLAGWCYVEAKQGTTSLWKQPIIITQSKYGSSVLNDWDGSFQIDEDAGTVMGTMFAAGRKTSNNTFEGVIMGDVQAGLKNSKAGKTGLYGFNDGIESFGLKVDGTAFFGKPGSGQILVNGNKGTIRSAEWPENLSRAEDGWRRSGKGMEIDFDDATIRMVGDTTIYEMAVDEDGNETGEYKYQTEDNKRTKVISQEAPKVEVAPNIIMTARPLDSDQTYFEIQGVKQSATEDGVTIFTLNPLMKIAQEEYYLQSLDFDGENPIGTKINIADGSITSYNFQVNAFDGEEQTIWLNSSPNKDPYYFRVGKEDNFISFNKEGEMRIQLNSGNSEIQAKNFELNAWSNNRGIYLNSQPGKPDISPEWAYYLKLGNSSGHIEVNSEGSMEFYSKANFVVNAVNSNSTKFLYLNSNGEGIITVNLTNGEQITYGNVYFGVGQLEGLEGKNPSYLLFADDKLSVKGRVESDEGKIGSLNIGQDGLTTYADSHATTTTNYTLDINFGPLRETSFSKDPAWATNKDHVLTFSFAIEQQVTDFVIDPHRCFSVAGESSDISSGGADTVTIEKRAVTLADKSTQEYITKVSIEMWYRKEGQSGFADGAYAKGTLEYALTTDTYSETIVSAEQVATPRLKNRDFAMLKKRVEVLSKLTGLGDLSGGLGSSVAKNNNIFSTIELTGAIGNTIYSRAFLGYNYWSYYTNNGVKQERISFNDTSTIFNIYPSGTNESSNALYIKCDAKSLFSVTEKGLNAIAIPSSGCTIYDSSSMISGAISVTKTVKNGSGFIVDYLKVKNTIAAAKIADTDNSPLLELGQSSVSVIPTLKVKGQIIAEGGLLINNEKESTFSGDIVCSNNATIKKDLTLSGNIINNGHSGKLGALAFADSVKKNFDVSITGDITLTKDISSDLQAYEYTVVTQEPVGQWVNVFIEYSGTTPYTYTDADGSSQTVDVPYSGTVPYQYWYPGIVSTMTYSGKEYTGNSNISITEEVTLKGNTNLELGPSNTETETESISITGTQQ